MIHNPGHNSVNLLKHEYYKNSSTIVGRNVCSFVSESPEYIKKFQFYLLFSPSYGLTFKS